MSSIQVEDVRVTFERDALSSVFNREGKRAPGDEPAPGVQAGGRVIALDQCNLQVADGETVCVVGPSGCGKSTLLRVIAGLQAPVSGRVLYDGQDMINVAPKDRGIGMVFQNYALYPHWESQENLGFFFRLRKREAEIPGRVRITAEIMGIGFERLLARKPPTLSGGEQQRVAIARCIVRDPRLFLFDEPLSNLDAKLRTQTRIEIKRLLHRFAITAIYVTHDQAEAMALGDRLAIMRNGRVDQIGAYHEIYERPRNAYVAGFLGLPPMNLFPAQVSEGRLQAPGGLSLPLPERWQRAVAAGQPVLAGIRPEHFHLDRQSTFQAKVDLVEPIFAQRIQLVYFMLDDRRLVAQLPGDVHLQAGDTLPLAVSAEHLHLFDAGGEARLAEN